MKVQDAIKNLIELKCLSQEDAYEVALEIMNGNATDAQIAALLVALKIKGEGITEITGFARAMREKVIRIDCHPENLVDTCGTGGDNLGTFNISTTSAFVAAGAGCKVAKHGNRSVSSRCGSADLLEKLGINIEATPERTVSCINNAGIGFLFAPLLHPAMKYAMGPRKEIGVRTIFNILGPLTNPAGARRQVLGIFNKELTEPIANVLKNLGAEHCLVVHGEDGLDEITTTGRTFVSELHDGLVESHYIEPQEFGIKKGTIDDIKGGDVADNARITLDILHGSKGPKREIVVLNAGAAIYVGGKASSLAKGIELAKESIDSGNAMDKLQMLMAMTK